MDSLPRDFVDIVAKAVQFDGISTSLKDLFILLKLSESELTLDNVETIKEVLESVGFELVPSLSSGSLTSERILRSKKNTPILNLEIVKSEITGGENSVLEFKSSMLFDHKKANFYPNLPNNDYLSEEVTLSCLKTIAAFLNSDGGILYLGVEDSGHCIGLEHDCRLLGQKMFNADKWELRLRELLKTRFKEGKTINDYVDIKIIEIDGVFIARLKVLPRTKLSFVLNKDTKKPILFRRQGNQTTNVEIDEVEEFINFRNQRT